MAPPEQGSGAMPEVAGAAALRTEVPCICGREEPMPRRQHHERKLSSNASFSTATAASPTPSYASTNYLPASSKLSCESIPYAGADLRSFSSTSSSYESFYHIEGEALDSDLGPGPCIGHGADAAADSTAFMNIDEDEPTTTRPPAVQTMKPHKSRKRTEGGDAAAAYDPKRLPSSMLRARSTKPANWSGASNESTFSIQLSSSGDDDLTAQYADFYYDTAGVPRFPSQGRKRDAALRLPSSSQSSGGSGGLCVTRECARCGTVGNKTRKSVRFVATESISGEGKHSVVVSTLEVEETTETEMEAPAVAATEAPAAGWCALGCCLGSSSPTAWWSRCCRCQGCGCHCKWWF